jgi:hypothetical protein
VGFDIRRRYSMDEKVATSEAGIALLSAPGKRTGDALAA